MTNWQKWTKRGFDILVATGVLLVLSPVLLVVAFLIRVTMGHPILFRQKRPGLHGESFTILKFRTMRATRDDEDAAKTDGRRLTSLGRFLRRTSLDELPELWNVLRGDMSLVGPRPLLVRYLPYMTEAEHRRHSVLPGITGWAQINGRNEASWEDRFAMDLWYIDNQSLRLDLKILILTLQRTLLGSGVVVDARTSMPNLDEARQTASHGQGPLRTDRKCRCA